MFTITINPGFLTKDPKVTLKPFHFFSFSLAEDAELPSLPPVHSIWVICTSGVGGGAFGALTPVPLLRIMSFNKSVKHSYLKILQQSIKNLVI